MKINNSMTPQSQIKKQPAFTSAASLSQKLLSGGALRKFSDAIEYDKFSMSSASLLGLFYAAVILPRYVQAYDKYDRYEIIRRDLISLTALTFMAKALSKGFSEIFSKTSGFVLNQKPKDFNKLGVKLWNYINPESEFQPLKSDQIISKYSQIDKFKNGLVDFCDYINNEKNGNIKKVLSFDSTVKANVEKILGKSIDSASYSEMIEKFKGAKDSDAMKEIYKVFSTTDNPFVKHAKMKNNVFGFISTFLLVPALIVWIAKSNEAITKRRITNDIAAKEAKRKKEEVKDKPAMSSVVKNAQNSASASAKETFAYFLGDNKKA